MSWDTSSEGKRWGAEIFATERERELASEVERLKEAIKRHREASQRGERVQIGLMVEEDQKLYAALADDEKED